MNVRGFHGLMAALVLAVPAAAYADAAVEAPIRTMVAAFNKGDVALAKTTHVAAPMIVDEPIAPFAWGGLTAFDDWIAALGKSEAAEGKSGGVVAIGAVTRETVMGDHAYVIFPSTYTFQQKGKTMRETGSMTFALVKQGAGWKISAWTWSSPEAVLIK
jgi:ketosteroid isomerase-like protein